MRGPKVQARASEVQFRLTSAKVFPGFLGFLSPKTIAASLSRQVFLFFLRPKKKSTAAFVRTFSFNFFSKQNENNESTIPKNEQNQKTRFPKSETNADVFLKERQRWKHVVHQNKKIKRCFRKNEMIKTSCQNHQNNEIERVFQKLKQWQCLFKRRTTLKTRCQQKKKRTFERCCRQKWNGENAFSK